VNYEAVVRETVKKIGYDAKEKGMDYRTANIVVAIEAQSPDIAQAVHIGRRSRTLVLVTKATCSAMLPMRRRK